MLELVTLGVIVGVILIVALILNWFIGFFE